MIGVAEAIVAGAVIVTFGPVLLVALVWVLVLSIAWLHDRYFSLKRRSL